VLEWLEAAGAEGRTVLLATHHLDGLAAVVDRVILLDDGLVAADEETAALRARRWLEIVTVAPVPAGLPAAALVLPRVNGRLHLRVPGAALAEAVRVLAGRPLQIHEPSLEDLLREGRA
jgi:ABC-type multidrug transport system ATPase subunit